MFRIPALFFTFSVLATFAQGWKPIQPAELSATAPRLDKNADAELVFWDVFVLDEFQGPQGDAHVTTNYKRIKVYNDRGVEVHHLGREG